MKIAKVEIIGEDIPLKRPFVTSRRRIEVIRDYVVVLTTDGGLHGFGACAPTPVITGDTVGSILYAVEQVYKPLLEGSELNAELLPAVQGALFHNSSPKAAVDMALYDLLAQEAGVPLCEYLGSAGGAKKAKGVGGGGLAKTEQNASAEIRLETDATVSLGSPDAMAREAAEHLQNGFSALKVKLGGPKEADAERLQAISAAINADTVLRLDANQAWSVDDALYVCAFAEDGGLNVEFVEQPVPFDDIEGMAALTKALPFRVLADESVFSPTDAARLIKAGGCDMLNIKLMKCGGIYEGLKIHAIAEESGLKCMVGCMMEGPVSVTAAAHFAAGLGISALDLDPPYLCRKYALKSSARFEGKDIYIAGNGGNSGVAGNGGNSGVAGNCGIGGNGLGIAEIS